MLESYRRGFTMIEMIMVIALAGIVATIGGPRIGVALQRRTTASAADEFALAHSLSRSTAIRYARIAQFHIDAPGKRFWVDVDTSANGSGQRATIAYVRDVSTTGLTMTSSRALLCFDARGLPSTTGSCEPADAKIVFSDGAGADSIVTTALGKILRW
jgi:prepilin-type N-terminal cleavage/methylation domain-containing protein